MFRTWALLSPLHHRNYWRATTLLKSSISSHAIYKYAPSSLTSVPDHNPTYTVRKQEHPCPTVTPWNTISAMQKHPLNDLSQFPHLWHK